MGTGRRLVALIRRETRQVLRDRLSLGVLLVLPVFLLVMFGYAISMDVTGIPMAILDFDRSAASRDLAESFFRSDSFVRKPDLASYGPVDRLLDTGAVTAVLVIPQDFDRDLRRGEGAEVQVIIDGSDSTRASTALGYIDGVIADRSRKLAGPVAVRPERRGGPAVEPEPRIWYNPELDSTQFLVPGLITLIIIISAVISTALSIVREKERGTMEQVIVSPIRPAELILGKTVPYFVLSLLVTWAVILASVLMFGMTIKGSLALLFLVIVLFLLGSLGLGMLVSAIAETQQVAFLIAIILTFLPSFILSGFVFPIRNMPLPVQAVTYLIPARYFLAALRGIMIKGTGWREIWPDAASLAVFAAVILTVSSVRLSWRKR